MILAFGRQAVLIAGALAASALPGCSQATTPDEVRRGLAAPVIVVTGAARPEVVPLTVTRIGHATVLLNFGGKYVLTDPWFTHRPGFLSTEPLGMAPNTLPPLAAVVVSHEHYDHNDMAALAAAYPDRHVPIITTAGGAQTARAAGFTDVRVVKPWERVTLDGIAVTAAPASHHVPENTYVIEAGGRVVFFGGDTRRILELDEVARRFPRIDVALLPVNGLAPRSGAPFVMNDVEAADLCRVLHPTVAIPIHYAFSGGFLRDLTLRYTGTAQGFTDAAKKACTGTRAAILTTGQPLQMRN